MKQSEYEALKAKVEELRVLLAMAVIEKPKFEAKGNWAIQGDGHIEQIEYTVRHRKYFNTWETEEQAKQASFYQYNHNLVMNYVMQFDGKLGKNGYCIYENAIKLWDYTYLGSTHSSFNLITMSKECAKALVQDIKDGIVVFKEIK